MPSPVPAEGTRGYLVPIGGGEDRVRDRDILQRFTDLCGPKPSIAVVPTASEDPDTAELFRGLFLDLGASRVEVVDVAERAHADESRWSEMLDRSTGIFLTGGNQLRLSTVLGGTPVATRIRRLHARGVPVGGTSAGAAFLCEHMIAGGSPGATPRAGGVALAPGLGLTNRIVIDQHFRERDRLGRLLSALSYNPFPVGFGLDEDTAAFVDGDGEVEVVGSGAITVVDLARVERSGMATAVIGEPVQLVGVRLHVLPHGSRYSLATRTVI